MNDRKALEHIKKVIQGADDRTGPKLSGVAKMKLLGQIVQHIDLQLDQPEQLSDEGLAKKAHDLEQEVISLKAYSNRFTLELKEKDVLIDKSKKRSHRRIEDVDRLNGIIKTRDDRIEALVKGQQLLESQRTEEPTKETEEPTTTTTALAVVAEILVDPLQLPASVHTELRVLRGFFKTVPQCRTLEQIKLLGHMAQLAISLPPESVSPSPRP